MEQIAEEITQVLMQRFAPTEQRFEVDEGRHARTLYQRFTLLKSLLESDVFEGAVHYVLRRPFCTGMEEKELRRPGQGVLTSSELVRQISRSGPRTRAE